MNNRIAHHTTIELKPKQPTEHQIQTQIINFLRYKGWYVQRMNSGKIRVGEGRSQRMIQMNEVGTPDVMAFKTIGVNKAIYGLPEVIALLFIEVKRPGNKPTLHQKMKMQELTEHGARCIVAHSIEDVEEAIK